MSEFNNRIAAQRVVLELVNQKTFGGEHLFGLSKKSIERWRTSNVIRSDDRLYELLISVADVLFFLANKSQEQVTDEYRAVSSRYSLLVEEMRGVLGRRP